MAAFIRTELRRALAISAILACALLAVIEVADSNGFPTPHALSQTTRHQAARSALERTNKSRSAADADGDGAPQQHFVEPSSRPGAAPAPVAHAPITKAAAAAGGKQPQNADNLEQQQQNHQQKEQQRPVVECSPEGYPSASRPELWWSFVDDSSPALMDVVHSQDRVYALFNLKMSAPASKIPWADGHWNMSFHVGESGVTVPAQPVTKNHGGSYVLMVFAYVPPEVLLHHHQQQQQQQQQQLALWVEIAVAVEMPKKGIQQRVYQDAPFCMSHVPPLAPVLPINSSSSSLQPAPSATAAAGAASSQSPAPFPQPSVAFRHLVGCTEILASRVLQQVPEWVVYHLLQGYQHMYVYVDDDPSLAARHLAPLISAGLVTVVDFRCPEKSRGWTNPKCPSCKTSWSQQSQMHSCILRSRGRARWLALHDVDEFFQVMQPRPASAAVQIPATTAVRLPESVHSTRGSKGRKQHEQPPVPLTVAEFLTARSDAEHIAAYEISTWWFASHNNASRQAAINATSDSHGGLVIGRYMSRAHKPVEGVRTKLILRPSNVACVGVHVVVVGGEARKLNASSEVRMAHYKPAKTQPVEDVSLAQYAPRVEQLLGLLYNGSQP